MTLGVIKLAKIARIAKTPIISTSVNPAAGVRREVCRVEVIEV